MEISGNRLIGILIGLFVCISIFHTILDNRIDKLERKVEQLQTLHLKLEQQLQGEVDKNVKGGM